MAKAYLKIDIETGKENDAKAALIEAVEKDSIGRNDHILLNLTGGLALKAICLKRYYPGS